MKTSRIRNVIFDIGNVLVDFCWLDHMKTLGFSDECIATLTRTMMTSPLWDELDMGIRPHTDVITDMKAAAPMYSGQIDAFFDAIMGIIRVRPESAQWLSSLKERGLNVYLLSNYPRWMFEHHLQVFDFLPFVDGRVVSSYINIMKPDPGIYLALLKKYNLKAEECVFVDDRAVNTQAAEKLGIPSVTYTDRQQAEQELEAILAQ